MSNLPDPENVEAFKKGMEKKLKVEDEDDKPLLIINYLRPHLVKLTLHFILLYLALRAYIDFASSASAYQAFLETLDEKLIIDFQLIDYADTCPDNYEVVSTTIFPQINAGCRCDFEIYPTEVCEMLNSYNATSTEKETMKENCVKQDKLITRDKSQLPPSPAKRKTINSFDEYSKEKNLKFSYFDKSDKKRILQEKSMPDDYNLKLESNLFFFFSYFRF